ncbi:hypothetical protein N665_1079s0002 [Sinapis alba]|nr:hypothetical protein N665_1079s0002 [Sinapis alba]
MDPPVSDQKEKEPSFHCDLYDTELVHKTAQTFLPGLATACVDNTTGDIFRSPGSVAADIRKEMIDYLTQRSETFVAEHILVLQGGSDSEASSHDPFDIVSDFIDDFATSKRNLFSRVSGWLLSERREDNVDDFAQEMEISGFWLTDHRQGLAQTLLKNVDFKNTSHCEMKFQTQGELAEHGLKCGYRTMNCENEGCNAVFCAKQMENHDSVCPFKIIPCEQNCSESIMRREMDRHCITVCPMKLVNCAFHAVGCLSDVRQCEIQQHQLDNVSSHLMCVLKSIYKEASLDDLKPRAEQIQQLSTRLSEARNARSLTNLVKEIDAKLGPLEIKPKSITVLESDKLENAEKKEAEVKGKPETAGSVEQAAEEEEVVSKEAEVSVDDVKKVSEAEIAENVNEEGELKAQKLLEIGEFIKEGENSSAADLSERTETKAPEVVVMDEDREEEESVETKQSRTNETRVSSMELSISQSPCLRFSHVSPRFLAASHHHRPSVHLSRKLLTLPRDAAFTSLSSSCMRSKLVSTSYRKISIRACSQAGAAGSDPVLDRISRFQNACWRFLRPHTIRGTALGSTALVARALIENTHLIKWSLVLKALSGLLALICGNGYIVGINQIYDIGIDKVNKPYLPIAAGDLSVQSAWLLVIFFAIAGLLVVGFNFGPFITCLYSLGLFLGTIYSVPPLRMKRFPVAAFLIIATVRGFLLNFGVYHATRAALGLSFQWSAPVAFITSFVTLFALVIAITKDLPDVEGDRKFQISTLATKLGVRNIAFLGSGLLLVNYISAISLAFYMPQVFRGSLMIPAHMILALCLIFQTWVLEKANYTKEAIAGYYRFIWNLFYAEYLLFPFF